MKKITLKNIAAHFSVSISTASKAITGSHEISAALKEKIQQYATEKHYKPNRLALNLLNKSNKTIGVIVPNILNYFFIQVLCGIEKIANEKGYNIISCISDESFEKESKTLEFLDSGTVDGLIVSLSEETQEKKKIKALMDILDNHIPLVLFDRVSDLVDCDKVIVDDFEAGYKSTTYFLDTGCRAIALVSPISKSSVGKLRFEGYKKALAEKNIPFDKNLVVNLGKNDDLDVLMSLLLNHVAIDAILSLDEITAVKVLRIVKSRGYRVPEDISIIGFTNGQLSEFVTPALTTVSQHGKYIGESAAKQLIERIETPQEVRYEFQTKVVKTSLVVRESTKALF
jgi:LacI family transcriptional regulator